MWDEDRQSDLIESAFLGIPIPSLYMATNTDSTWEVVDGVQRLCTLVNFCGNPEDRARLGKSITGLVINDLEKLSALNKKNFDSLPPSVQLGFLTRPIKVTVLNDKSDLTVRFDLFERLNTGGVALTPQEVRNCIFRGPFNELLRRLAGTKNFTKVIKLKNSDQNNATYEDYVLRFFAYLDRHQEFDHSVKDFLNSYMKDKLSLGPHRRSRTLFAQTFDFLSDALPNGIVRGNRNITPVNLYEAIAVGSALAISIAGDDLDPRIVQGLLSDPRLKKLTTGATNSRKMVVDRICYVRDALVDL